MRDRAYRRHQNKRIIKKRLKIYRFLTGLFGRKDIEGGHFKKYNLSCNCGLCEKNTIAGKRIKGMQEKKNDEKTEVDLGKSKAEVDLSDYEY